MKKQAYTMIAIMVLIGSMAVAAQAQSNGRPSLRVNIPFEFNVGSKIMPAAEYLVRSVNEDSSTNLLMIQSRDGKASVMFIAITVEGKAQESTKLIFNRYGNRYFFAEAWIDGERTGLQAVRSRAERVAQRELAGIKATADTVALKNR